MEFEFFRELKETLAEGGDFVLCTVVSVDGPSPAKPGQKMIVRPNGTIRGTVGGGVNEERIRKAALELFARGGSRLLEFEMQGDISSPEPICGGRFSCFTELIRDRPRLFIFGGGHIGNALARLAHVLRFSVTVVDERPEYVTAERLPTADHRICKRYEESVADCAIDARSSVVIVTPGHVKDREVLEHVVRTPALYIGMIGSARKWDELRGALVAQGHDRARLAEVHCPIGVNLIGQAPEEIALGILAQIVARQHGKVLPFLRD